MGAVLAARVVPLKRAVSVLPVGILMGFVVMALIGVTWMPLVYALLILVGALAGFFVVPMNALLQHRGHVLMGAGPSIAVQNFNENIGILVMVGMYLFMVRGGMNVNRAIVMFGLFVAATMLLVLWRHLHNQSKLDSLKLIPEDGDGRGHH